MQHLGGLLFVDVRIQIFALLQQRHGLAVVAVGEVFQRLAVDVVDFQRQFAGAEVVALYLERVHGVVDLAADVAAALLAEFAHQVETVERHGVFAVNSQLELLQRHRLIAELNAEFALVAVAFQVEALEGDLLVLLEGVRAAHHDVIAVGVEREALQIAGYVGVDGGAAEFQRGFILLVLQRDNVDGGRGIAAVRDARIGGKQRFAFGYLKQRFHRRGVFQLGMHRRHAWQQIEFLQLSEGERTVVDGFQEGHFITGFQFRAVGGIAAVGAQNQTYLAVEQAALVIFIAQLHAGFRQVSFQLAVGVVDDFAHVLLDQFPGVPGCPGPCCAKNHNDADSD